MGMIQYKTLRKSAKRQNSGLLYNFAPKNSQIFRYLTVDKIPNPSEKALPGADCMTACENNDSEDEN